MWYRSRKYFVDENFFRYIETQDQAYILGYLYADGVVIPPYAFSVSSTDLELLKNTREALRSTHPISLARKVVEGKIFTINTLLISCKQLVGDLINCGCIPRKSGGGLRFPEMLEGLQSHFIRGYFDGDGCVRVDSKNNLRVDFVGCFELLNDIKLSLEKYTAVGRVKIHPHGNVYRLEYSGNMNAKEIREFMYKDAHFSLERKKRLIFSIDPKYLPRKIL